MVNAAHRWTGIGRAGMPWLAAGILAFGLAGLPLAADAAGESKKSAKTAKAPKEKSEGDAQKDAAAAQRAYAAGLKAFEAGDMAGAEQNLSSALAGGGLPNAQMARALYYRGAAYRKQGRPAQAISDLTTAVWLKGGLPEDLKKKATEERQLAYQEAGLGSSPPAIGTAPLDQATASAPGAKSGAQVVNASQSSPSFWNFLSLPSLTGSSQPAQPPAAAQTASVAAPAPGVAGSVVSGFGPAEPSSPSAQAQASSWDTQTAEAQQATPPPPQQVASAAGYTPVPEASGLTPMGASAAGAPAAAPTSSGEISNPLAGTGSAVSGFFSNIFGSGTSSSQVASTEGTGVTTGSNAQTLAWGSETTVATAQTSSMVQRGPESPTGDLPWAGPQTAAASVAAPVSASAAAPAPAKTKTASAGPAGGAFKLQVAAVRSREEAERLAQSLSGYQAVQNGTVSTEIDEAVIGSMGTFYRVRLGPYADAKEPGQLCKTLRPQGFDCLVVTQ
jgi:cell division septation protein DedD